MVNVILLFVAAVLYGSAVGGGIEILVVFVMKEPLNWSATQVTFCSLSLPVFKFCVCDSDA